MKDEFRKWIRRGSAVGLVALAVFLAVRGCAFMPWNAQRGGASARVTVSRDFGKEVLRDEVVEVGEGSSAMEALREVAEVETAYGGGFIRAVDGMASQYEGGAGNKVDWFFYVNGQMADVGAGEYAVRDGDWLTFDFHSWEYSMFTPVLAGCFPEPFVHGYAGPPESVTVVYAPGREEEGEKVADFLAPRVAAPCRLVELGAEWAPEKGDYALLLGTWEELVMNAAAGEAFRNHARLGLFAFFEEGGLCLLDGEGSPVGSMSGSIGLVQGSGPRLGDGTSALMLTGSDDAGLHRVLDYLLGADSRVLRPVPGMVLPASGEPLDLPVEGD